MKVLLTGSQGGVGRWLAKALLEAGHTIRTVDRSAQARGNEWEHLPGDVRDLSLIRRAVVGMDAVIHAAALMRLDPGMEDTMYSINIQGVWNVLIACTEAGVPRVVNFSSLQALGHSNPRHTALSFPLDDDTPKQPAIPYQITKHVGEEMCQAYAVEHGLTIASLRPTYIFQPFNEEHRQERSMPEEILAKYATKDYWSFVDVRDVCAAALICLSAPLQGHRAFLLSSDFTYSRRTTIDLAAKYYPHFRWCKVTAEEYTRDNPYRSLLDCQRAKDVLGWQPVFSQREEILGAGA